MFRYWYDIERDMAAVNNLWRKMDRVFGEPGTLSSTRRLSTWPKTNLYDGGNTLIAVMAIPGVHEKNLKVEAYQNVLTVSGERKVDVPKGYRFHRRERQTWNFTRSIGLPSEVDLERTSATLRDGMLTVTMEKHPEAQPKTISVVESK